MIPLIASDAFLNIINCFLCLNLKHFNKIPAEVSGNGLKEWKNEGLQGKAATIANSKNFKRLFLKASTSFCLLHFLVCPLSCLRQYFLLITI